MAKEYEIDEIDREIIKILSFDSKTNYREISKRIGTSLGTIHNRINNLKEKQIINQFSLNIDAKKIGYRVTAIILIQIEGKHIQQVQEKIANERNIYAIYDTTGEWDSIIIGKFKTIDNLNDFIKKINKYDHIKKTATQICLNIIKEVNFLPLD